MGKFSEDYQQNLEILRGQIQQRGVFPSSSSSVVASGDDGGCQGADKIGSAGKMNSSFVPITIPKLPSC